MNKTYYYNTKEDVYTPSEYKEEKKFYKIYYASTNNDNRPEICNHTSGNNLTLTGQEVFICEKKNVLFACTTLDKTSTLSENFDAINTIVRQNIPEQYVLNAYFVYKTPRDWPSKILESNDLETTLNDNNYIISGYPKNINLTDFLTENPGLKFDKIIITQCNETISTIMGEGITPKYDIIVKNLLLIYNSLQDDGNIMNYGDGETDGRAILHTFSTTISIYTLQYLPYFLFIIKLIPYLFTEIGDGIYTKKLYIDLNNKLIEKIKTDIKTDIINNIEIEKGTREGYYNFFNSILPGNENIIISYFKTDIGIEKWRQNWQFTD